MRKYDFQNEWQKLLVPDIVALLTQIHEFKGEQNLFIEANSDTLTQLVEVAKSRVPRHLIKLKVSTLLTSD